MGNISKELAPYDEDWFYTRTASMARHLYVRSPWCKNCLQNLWSQEEQRFRSFSLECRICSCGQESPAGSRGSQAGGKDPNGGRRLTSQGRRDLDRIAAQIKASV